MSDIIKIIKKALAKKGSKQEAVIDGKRTFISAKETPFIDNPLKLTITTKIIDETEQSASERLYSVFKNLDFIVQGKSPYRDCRIFLKTENGGFATKKTPNGILIAMMVGLEKRKRWSNY